MRFHHALLRLLLCCIAMLCMMRQSFALNVELAHHDAPRPGQWELLSITLPSPPRATIAIRDARGGLTVSSLPTTGSMDPATGEFRILLPLPYLAEAELPPKSWPIIVTITSMSGAQIERIGVPRSPPLALAPGGRSSLRIIAPEDLLNPAANIPPQLSSLPIIITPMRQEEILTGPLLLFASCDVLLLSPELAAKLPEDRAAALINTGLQLLTIGDPLPPKSPLSRFSWHPITPETPAAWITPSAPLPRPQVLDNRLARARILHIEAQPTTRTVTILLLIPIASLILLILSRGLFRRPAITLLAVALAFVGLSIITIAYLKNMTPPTILEIAWSTQLPNDDPAARTSLLISESFTAITPLFAHQLQTTADQSIMLFPTFASPRQYFALQNAQLSLDAITRNGQQHESSLEINLPPRGFVLSTTRSAVMTNPLPPSTINSTHGVWIEGGQVYARPPSSENSETPVILPQWAAGNPHLQPSLLAWYELGMIATHRYFLDLSNPSDPTAKPTLNLIDLGPPRPSTSQP